MKPNQSTGLIFLPLLALLSPGMPDAAWAQAAQANQQVQQGVVKPPADPLNRESPYGAVTGFLKAAEQGNYELAAAFLQLPRRKPSARTG